MDRFFSTHLEKGVQTGLRRWLLRTWHSSPHALRRHPFYPLFVVAQAVYRMLLMRDQERSRARCRHLPRPVISVGNLVAGGTGKTPLVLWIAEHLRKKGLEPAVLSRGYGGKSLQMTKVPELEEHRRACSLYGDEPVLLAAKGLTVWIGRERYDTGMKAVQQHPPDMFLLDDGFQHVRLGRDLDLVLLDACKPFGNGLLLPFGPLREPVDHLCRADAFILTRAQAAAGENSAARLLQQRFPERPVFSCRHRLTGFHEGLHGERVPSDHLKKSRVVAFSGIANPGGFLQSLQEAGIEPTRFFAFGDHHFYRPSDLDMVAVSAENCSAGHIITTEKDFVRLPRSHPAILRRPTVTARVTLDFGRETEAFQQFLEARLEKITTKKPDCHGIDSRC